MKGDVKLRFIGSKANLIDRIEGMVKKHVKGSEETFLDLFAGTNVVGHHFKKDYTVYSNDLLYFSYCHAKATIENNSKLTFERLKERGVKDPFDYLMSEEIIEAFDGPGYYEKAYTPTGDRKYLSVENGKRIDATRTQISEWREKKWVTEYEYYYLLTSLIESIPFVSNTTGTYGAFLKHWDKRALRPLELKPLEVINNHRPNKAF